LRARKILLFNGGIQALEFHGKEKEGPEKAAGESGERILTKKD